MFNSLGDDLFMGMQVLTSNLQLIQIQTFMAHGRTIELQRYCMGLAMGRTTIDIVIK